MSDDSLSNPERRTLVGGAAALGVAAASTSSLAQGNAPARPLTDPRTKYTQGPMPDQSQPWPALASKMNPRPDHGEASYRGSGRLAGRKALITGGDSGIGRAAAIAFAREGADVAINYFPTEEPDAREVVDLIRQTGRKAVAIPGDLREASFCKTLPEEASSKLGGLDIVVNNAGYQQAKESILDISDEQFDRTFKTNVYAMFHICKAAVPLLKPGAVIINTGSVNSYDPVEEMLDYASTKGAILIFTKGLAKQLAKKGIRVNMVAPGPVWTPLQVAGGQLPGKLPEFGKEAPLGRPGQPAELAPLFVALASDETSFTSGGVFGAHGGHGNP